MTPRTIDNGRLIDGAKLDNLPADVNASLALKEDKANKGIAGGYASLDGAGTVPLAQLPAGMGNGDMLSSTYDPSLIAKDLFVTGQVVFVDITHGDDATGNGTRHAPFKNIQAAIDSTTGPTAVRGTPGIYPDDIVMRDGVAIGMPLSTITGKITCNGTNFFSEIQYIRTSIITETAIDAITNTSSVFFDFCLVELNTSTDNIQPILIESGNGSSLDFTTNNIVLTNTSTGINNIDTSVIKHSGTGAITGIGNTIFVDTFQTGSGNVTVIDDSSTGLITLNSFQVQGNGWTAGYTGSIIGVHTQAAGAKVYNNPQMIFNGTGSDTGTGFKTSGGASITLELQGGRTDIIGFANNQYTDIGATDVINSFFNDLCANCTNVGVGTLNKVDAVDGKLRLNTQLIDENLLLGTPTNESLQDVFNIGFNAGWVSGSEITTNGDGTCTVALGTGLIRISDTDQAQLKSFDIAENASVTLVDSEVTIGASNIIYVDYNSGTPIYASTTVREDILDNENNKYEVGEVVREGNTLHITNYKQQARSQGQQRAYSLNPIARADNAGLILSDTGTRNIAVSGGGIYIKYSNIPVVDFDTSVTGTFDSYYTSDSFTSWTKVTGATQWGNTQYNDITSGLVAISPASRWTYLDFYLDGDGETVAIYGQAQFASEQNASEAPLSSTLPARLLYNGLLIGRLVFQGNAATATVLTAFTTTFSGGVSTDHSNLSNLSWTASGHTDGINSIAGFDGAGLASAYTLSGTGTVLPTTVSPTFTTPALGTPASGVATNLTGTASGLTAGTVTTNANLTGDVTSVGNATTITAKPVESIVIAISDETTDLTTGTAKSTFRMPYAFTVTEVRASVTTVATGATLLTFDINETGSTILSTKITIDASEKTSTTAATAPVISDASLADDAEITIDIDAVGNTTTGKGAKIYLIGNRT